jgi:glucosamine-6-phosphate deaminase
MAEVVIVDSPDAAGELAIVEAGGVDLQVLGIGRTGHIGFNEPGSSLASLTRIKTLTEQTRADNARFFDSPELVPRHCITQGLGTILRARHLVLLAFGESKAEAVAGAVEGPVSASLPGSVIQLHPNVTVLIDDAAASRLRFADYYRFAWNNRPDWSR